MSDFVPNPRQKQAIEHVSGPMVVIAGAGTGKTRVLVERVARLVSTGAARPEEILAVTYTDKAANELREKLAARIGEGLNACTFHALCNGILQRAGQGFCLLEEKDLWILLRRRIEELGLKYYIKAAKPEQFLDALLDFFSRCQDELVDAARFRQYVEELRCGKHEPLRVTKSKKCAVITPAEHLERCQEIARVFAQVETMMREGNLGTFGDMITRAVGLLHDDAAVLQREQQRARFLLIDEFQDANVAQIEVARLLAGEERNVFAVGDPDQAIFRFRGASSAAFEEFLRRFPGTKAVALEENQRSTSKILTCAYTVIDANPAVNCRLPDGSEYRRRALQSAREQRAAAEGKPIVPQKVEIVLHGGKEEEASDIAGEVERLRATGEGDSIAIIYRSHSHGEEIAMTLAEHGISFVVKGLDVLETAVIRDLLACLKAVASLSNSEALFRVAALPVFGVEGDAMRGALAAASREASFATLLKAVSGGSGVMTAVEKARSYGASVNWNAAQVCAYVTRAFGFSESDEPVRILRGFVERWQSKPITESGTLEEFISYMELFRQAHGVLELPVTAPQGAVQLMTVHAAKGLEFDTVFVLRAHSSSFPANYHEAMFEFPQALREMPLSGDSKQIHGEEERRLFYVALTRARDSLRVYARPKKGQDTPAGPLRDLMRGTAAKECWRQRSARRFTATIAAAAAPATGVSNWLLMPPRPGMAQRSLSATSIDAYDTCPLKYKLMQDWHIPGPASAAMLNGKIMHDMLADIHQGIMAGRPRSEGEVLQRFREAIAAAAFDDDYQRRLLEQQGARQLSVYLGSLNQGPLPPVLQAEKKFEMKVEGVLVRGRMDRVDRLDPERVRVIDFKTGAAFDQKKADQSLQLSIYAMAARETLQAEPAELVIHNLDDNSPVCTTRDAAALIETRAKIATVAEGIAAQQFEAKPGFHCGYCEFRSLCPATEQKLYTIAKTLAVSN